MPAYWVARSKINDPVEYKKYTDEVPAIIARYGGKVLARGGRFQIMEGPDKFHRFVVIEFPTLVAVTVCPRSGPALARRGGVRWRSNWRVTTGAAPLPRSGGFRPFSGSDRRAAASAEYSRAD